MSRGASTWNYPWGPEDECPCGSTLAFGSCCLQPDGRAYVKLVPLQPAGPKTGFAHPRCYLSSSANCTKEISREHYITRALIARPGLNVRGMPWQSEPVVSLSPDALTAKVLCRRHNAALSPLDEHALRIYEELGKARSHATKRSLSRRNYAGIVSGEAFELWALKTMAGLYASGMDLRLGGYRFRNYAPQLEKVAEALINPKAQSMVRFEVPTRLDAHEETLGRAAVTTLFEVDDDADEMTAFVVRMHGLAFKFHLQPSGTTTHREHLLRPHILDLIGPRRTGRLYFGWPNAAAVSYVFVHLGEAKTRT
jgi:hypothetical protein